MVLIVSSQQDNMHLIKTVSLNSEPLTNAAFTPYGDVVSSAGDADEFMNGAAYARYLNLAYIDLGEQAESRVQLGLVKCHTPEQFPYMLRAMEKHPDSSQLFYPLFNHDYLIAVAPAGEQIVLNSIKLFCARADQGINYHRGIWHMPMLGIAKGDQFLMIERNDMHDNCEVYEFDQVQLKIELPDSIVRTVDASLLRSEAQ